MSGFLWDIFYFKTELKWNQVVGSVLIVSIICIVSLLKAFGIIKEEKEPIVVCKIKSETVSGVVEFDGQQIKVKLQGLS